MSVFFRTAASGAVVNRALHRSTLYILLPLYTLPPSFTPQVKNSQAGLGCRLGLGVRGGCESPNFWVGKSSRPSAPCTPRVKAELLCRAERGRALHPPHHFLFTKLISVCFLCFLLTCVLGSCVTSFHLLLSCATWLCHLFIYPHSVHRGRLAGRSP